MAAPGHAGAATNVRAIETVRNPSWSNMLWVRIETEDGLVGLGETFRHAGPIERYVHEHVAPYLLGRDALAVNAHAHALLHDGGTRFLGYPTRSVEIRANSAVDLALWDLRGRASGLSLTALLGGPARERVRIYNTCASVDYNALAGVDRARLVAGGAAADVAAGDDLAAQVHAPGELAASLLDEGITAMKVWPFDEAALREGGARISVADLDAALGRIGAIRDRVGDAMDVMLEYHGLWRQAPALRILREVDAYRPFWHEDPISMSEIGALAELRSRVDAPIAGSESHGTAIWFRDALAAGAVDYLHFDPGWVGGLSESLRIAHLAAVHDRLIAPHDCTSPVVWMVNLHLALSQPNALILESVRAFHREAYPRLVTALPLIEDGFAAAPGGPGIGTELCEELLGHPDTAIERTGR